MSMTKIGIFYGPEKGSVDAVAHKLAAVIGTDKVELLSLNQCTKKTVEGFDRIIFGISTVGAANWDSEHTNSVWDDFFPQLETIDWSNKTVAIFGLGDQIQYPNHFVDAMGVLYEVLISKSVKIVGAVSPEGYNFEESRALIKGVFVGLPIDEDSEPEQTDERLKKWVTLLKSDFKL